MGSVGFQPKLLILMVVVFVALVLVQLRWGSGRGESAVESPFEPHVAGVQVYDGREEVLIGFDSLLSPDELRSLMEGRVRVLLNGEIAERRAMAAQFAFMANDLAESRKLLFLSAGLMSRIREALLAGLKDPDRATSASCREALIGLWRLSPSTAVARGIERAAAAQEYGNLDQALEELEAILKMGKTAPPDVFRLRGEILLERGDARGALADGQRALQAEPDHFMARLLTARALRSLGQRQQAMEALYKCLRTYPQFPEALQLKAELER